MDRTPNRLIHEKSPYLEQHAHNPVDWHPWGEEAFALARSEDKPIFLSIGYSTCHWCHVMERESFEDEDIAALLRATVVAVKVDREERPDLDSLYMAFCQALTGRGGWPLTVFLTPDGQPFFAGTYFPKESGYGRTGLRELLQRVHMAWKSNRQAVIGNATQILEAVRDQMTGAGSASAEPTESDLESGKAQLTAIFDVENGGFGGAPKFPSPHNLLFLLREYRRTGAPDCLAMVRASLKAMRQGGVYDQVGFGLHRYATDARWFLPHFEKMLYDQALAAMAYTEAFLATGEASFKETALEIFEYVRRDLTSPDGLFYSAEDADSEGVEGKFYLWSAAELRELLGEDAALFMAAYGATEDGNSHDEATGEQTGGNILFQPAALGSTAAKAGLDAAPLAERLERCRLVLLAAREKRVRPLCDDKVLTDINGLMIAALAKAARAFDDEELAGRARRAADGILARLGLPQGRLLHRLRDGEAAIPGMLDDYAFLAWGLTELYQTVFDTAYLRQAVILARTLLDHFADAGEGGFFLTPDDGEALLLRQKIFYDAAIPSGNSVAFFVLTTLYRLTGHTAFTESAAALARAMAPRLADHASGHAFFLCGLSQMLAKASEVTIAGDPDSPDTHALARAVFSRYLPETAVVLRPDEAEPDIVELAPFTRYQLPLDGRAAAHVCRGGSCQPPTADVVRMLELLGV
ncbi:Thymidylate kinase [Desulfovibrio sp. DV]|uniref:thioredoxin domain-containing protein n=1 Tax=Desulfovibrio sp. DV TaxID=1844708 RepID=UPI00094B87D3|nr:thioredoxin domain-containing protein [Desulfovibrio sp. DV]OLN31129.1 Thymidylate kinase [Desulfovibrio sp. DV]